MSHFSKIKTSIKDIDLLKKTLINLNFNCNDERRSIKNLSGQLHSVNLIAKNNSNSSKESLVGFFWENNHYSVVVDLDFWSSESSFNFFIEQLNQSYALNMVLKQTEIEGFQKIKQSNLSDGSVKLIVQRWV